MKLIRPGSKCSYKNSGLSISFGVAGECVKVGGTGASGERLQGASRQKF